MSNAEGLRHAEPGEAADARPLKGNQAATLSEPLDGIRQAQDGWKVVIAERSRGAEDTLMIGLKEAPVKAGASLRGEITAKDDGTLRIEEGLGALAVYADNRQGLSR